MRDGEGQDGRTSHRAPDRRERGRAPEAFEDCAKAIFALEERFDGPAATNALAERLEITPGSVTATLKRMDAAGLIEHEPYHGARLTEAGRRLALEVLRHHRLLETYLSEELGMSWDRVHAEAEVLEHHISEELEGRMAAALGDPRFDPHGDPIPSSELTIASEGEALLLAELRVGERARVLRVSDSDPELLRMLEALEIRVGTDVELTGREQLGGLLRVRVGVGDKAEAEVLGREVAERIRVRRI